MTSRIVKTPFTSEWFAGLLFEYQWQGSFLTYSIPFGTATFARDYSSLNEWDNWFALKPSQATQFRNLAKEVNNYIQLSFIEVADGTNYGDIRIAYTDSMSADTLGYAYLPTPRIMNRSEPSAVSGDIWLSPTLYNRSVLPGSDLHHILMHELGHALGLSHPFETNFPFPKTSPKFDHYQYSVMSYDWHPSHTGAYPVTFMPMDILALQYLYGVNLNHSPEDTIYQFNDIINIQTIWDPNGYNTLDFSALNSAVKINMNDGTFSSAGFVVTTQNRTQEGINNLALAFGTKIHEVIGSQFDDVIMGNTLDNTVYLGKGDDMYIYTSGQDYIDGEQGLNTIVLPGNFSDWQLVESNQPSFEYQLLHTDQFNQIITFSNISILQFDSETLELSTLPIENLEPTINSQLLDPQTPFTSDILGANGIIMAEEAQLYRIYLGVLDRLPDQSGFDWWLNRYNQDASFAQLIEGFYNSQEFFQIADANKDGQISNNELLNHLYINVLEREADIEGYNWWINTIQTKSVSHVEVIFSFTQSDEFVLQTLEIVGNFLWH